MLDQLVQSVVQWYMSHINYGTIAFLMAVESSFIPFPSEIIIPPAAWKAAQGELNIYLVVLSGSAGALLGAVFNYYISFFLGRKLVYRLAGTRFMHAMLINADAIEKAEVYFVKYGKISTFIGRLVPAIRQLISIPAGLSRMRMRDFLIYTALGATLWNVILAVLGYFLYAQKNVLHQFYKEITYGCIVLGLAFLGYLVYHGLKKEKPDSIRR
ncbi:MAG: DedA family protein [Desulfobacterales bacterium]|jgi:membrane protein DedA with SNARE-associated domain|nr:DedA family protein [Desulfobacterales bacterium]